MRDQARIGRTEPSRRAMLAGVGVVLISGLAACGRKEEKAADPGAPAGPPEGSLEWAIQGPWRAADRPRDIYRHPLETLRFFGLQPSMHVVEFWPGSGWYTEILAPYLNKGDGEYYGAGFATGAGAEPGPGRAGGEFRTPVRLGPQAVRRREIQRLRADDRSGGARRNAPIWSCSCATSTPGWRPASPRRPSPTPMRR